MDVSFHIYVDFKIMNSFFIIDFMLKNGWVLLFYHGYQRQYLTVTAVTRVNPEFT
jgi:hypothetical protein